MRNRKIIEEALMTDVDKCDNTKVTFYNEDGTLDESIEESSEVNTYVVAMMKMGLARIASLDFESEGIGRPNGYPVVQYGKFPNNITLRKEKDTEYRVQTLRGADNRRKMIRSVAKALNIKVIVTPED